MYIIKDNTQETMKYIITNLKVGPAYNTKYYTL